MSGMSRESGELIETLRRAAGLLQQADVRFALAGGFAAYAHGAAVPTHDVDFVIHEDDVRSALDALVADGMRPHECPEEWLVKACDGNCLIDLIFRPAGGRVDDKLLDRAVEQRVAAVSMPVLPATDLAVMRLLAFTENDCDFSDYLPVCRALREQIDWERVVRECGSSPYAYAFLTLLARLDVIDGGLLR